MTTTLRLEPPKRRKLFIDIETAPHKVYSFGLKNAWIGPEAIIEPGKMLCFAAKWSDGEMQFFSDWQHGHDSMLAAAYKLLDEADEVVHYNGIKFDEKRLNQEFAQKGWPPPSSYKSTDLWRTVNGRFDLPSQKLAYAVQHFNVPAKQSTGGIGLWIAVLNGEAWAQKKMEEYNRNDTAIMVPLDAKLKAWQ